MFVLSLNDMRSCHVETLTNVTRGTRAELLALLLREIVPPYTESGHDAYRPTTWHKSYRKGGPLEWYNPPSWALAPATETETETFHDLPGLEPVLSEEEAVEQTRARYREHFERIPHVSQFSS